MLFFASRAYAEIEIHQHMLENGMELYIIPNNKIPAISHMLWYRVGAVDEQQGKFGLAHYFEHLMFKGTKEIPAGEFSKIIARNGGRDNAFTSYDFTAYFQNIEKSYLARVMQMEADRMNNLILDENETKLELEVVIEERKGTVENDPSRLLGEQMIEKLYPSDHRYAMPIIGTMEHIKGLTANDAKEFYQKYYNPSNAIVIIAGDVQKDEVIKLAEKTYGGIQAGNKRILPQMPEIAIPENHKPIIFADERVNEKRVFIKIIPHNENVNPYALSLLPQILSTPITGLIDEKLVRKNKIIKNLLMSYLDLSLFEPSFDIAATLAENITHEEFISALNKEIDAIIQNGIAADKIEAAKNKSFIDAAFAREGLQTMAYYLGWALTTGHDKEYILNWEDNISKVSEEELIAALRAIRNSKIYVVGVLKNKPQPEKE